MGKGRHKSHGLSHQGLVARGICSSNDDNEIDGSSIPDWIEFRERLNNDLKKMDIDALWVMLHELIAEINHRWNQVAIENRMRKK